ncbi:MAG: nucleoside recognition protein [Gammaproteobacteria bacterium]|nr:nucleoside recognition protein [Gammaproteobacteria bacterium]
MLNYLWAGMIIISIVFSLASDVSDELNNRYKNGSVLNYAYSESSYAGAISFKVAENTIQYSQLESLTADIKIAINNTFPEHWKNIALNQAADNKKEIRADVISIDRINKVIQLRLPEVHWVKLRAVSNAAFDMAEFAIKLAIGLAGVMALWLGLMRIAEKCGLIGYFVRLIYPLLHYLFPRIEKDHPVFGSISLNMAANVLGLGNAATPMGIKAMQQLQELNKTRDKASDEMCMFLAINTSSVQLLPPVTLIAVMGSAVSELMVPIILATSASTIAAVISAKTFARLRNSQCN